MVRYYVGLLPVETLGPLVAPSLYWGGGGGGARVSTGVGLDI